jgi:aminopeptidase
MKIMKNSFGNPTRAVALFGKDLGQLLSAIYVRMRMFVGYAYEHRTKDMEREMTFFSNFSEKLLRGDSFLELQATLKKHIIDRSDEVAYTNVFRTFSRNFTAYSEILLKADLSNTKYLYQYGMYIGENEIKTAEFINKLPQEKINLIANTFSEAFIRGYKRDNKTFEGKKSVSLSYPLGFERIMRHVAMNFNAIGLAPLVFYHLQGVPRPRLINTKPSKQLEYDHRFDEAVYLDQEVVDAMITSMKKAYEAHQAEVSVMAGPTLMEVFGEKPFSPITKEEICKYSDAQSALMQEINNQLNQIQSRYLPRSTYSFTINSYPIPEIGKDFEAIFEEVIAVNTLDNDKYDKIQQAIIDVLDTTEFVIIKGMNGNKTNLKIALPPITDPQTQTNFNNCTADVNVPVGEVFTSPQLKGTKGLLHVSEVYLNGLNYIDLEIAFEDGMTTTYSCKNFEDEEKNKAYVHENLLHPHESLPLGEFAIGTNTTAYVMAQKYGINKIIPILIGEKMGPHFAIGDTCYTWAEDLPVYNLDGKEIIARDNEKSCLRKTDINQAYTYKHTDITLPYSELGSIIAITQQGIEHVIINEGRFVLFGTEALNDPFLESDEGRS